ncbi:hypothetical protein F5B21DRAFT_210029 [Xylaria acuta]|nr:hypothetical protein F5B21DRAFT_210029 [Xylaria acuta]
MDALEPRLATDEDGFAANMSSQPISQHFDDSLFVSEQFGNQFPLEWDCGLRSQWLPPPEDDINLSFGQCDPGHIGTHAQNQRMPLDTSDTIEPWSDVMDLTSDFCFVDGTLELPQPIETNMNLSVGAPDATSEPTSKPRRVVLNNRQKAILDEWIANNPEPYPSKEDKIILATSTGLTSNQVSSWFTRTRQRRLNRIHIAGTSIKTGNASSSTKHLEREHSVTPEIVSSPNAHTPASPGVFEGLWPSSASIPGDSGKRPTRKPPSRPQSLPSFFTLDFIGSYTSTPSPSLHDCLSLEALVSTRRSAASPKQEGRKRLAVIYGNRNHPRSVEATTKLDFIKIWVADVAQHTFYPSEGGGMLLRAEPDAALADGDNNDHAYVIGKNGKSKESLAPEDQEHKGFDWHGAATEIQHTKNELAQRAHRKRLRDAERMREERMFGKMQRTRLVEETRDSASFDAMSNAGSSASSANSAASYMSFGPRKGRRVAFHGSQNTTRIVEEMRDSTSFDAMSNAGSSASSANSAASYMSFGPRKGRRVAFHGSQDTRKLINVTPPSAASSAIWSDEVVSPVSTVPQKRKTSESFPSKSSRNTSTTAVLYPCTFCYKEFSTPYLWKRHEISSHAPQTQWVCGLGMPTGREARNLCPICTNRDILERRDPHNPSCTHRFEECWNKPASQRAFFRKDALQQHIETFHYKTTSALSHAKDIDLDKWTEKVDTVNYDLTCHFCGFTCEDWQKRALHISKHFRNGTSIKLWIPQGPYVLTPELTMTGEKFEYRSPWYCPFSMFNFGRFHDWHYPGYPPKQPDELQNCIFCGVGTKFLGAGSSLESRHSCMVSHIKSVHDIGKSCDNFSSEWLRAEDFVEHLLVEHSAQRGNWMINMILDGGDVPWMIELGTFE